jgi:UDP-glucose 4-epimerase
VTPRRLDILITGGFGYIGGRVVEAFARRSDRQLRVFARGASPVPEGFPAGVAIHRGDVLDRATLVDACRGASHVVHLAGLDQSACQASPSTGLAVSGVGTLNVAEAAAAAGVTRLLFISTFHVYGDRVAHRLDEDTVLRPRTVYGVSRMAGEALALKTARDTGLDVVVLRLTNGYGPPAFPVTGAWQLAVNDFCRQAVQHQRIVLRRSGVQQRDFIAMSDVVDAIDHFLLWPRHQLEDALFNIGSNKLRTLLELATIVQHEYAGVSGRTAPIQTGVDDAPDAPTPPLAMDRAAAAGFVPRDDVHGEVRRILAVAGGSHEMAPRAGESR